MAATAADMVTVVPEAWRLSAVGVGERLEALPVCVGGGNEGRVFSRNSGGRRGPARAEGAGACMRE